MNRCISEKKDDFNKKPASKSKKMKIIVCAIISIAVIVAGTLTVLSLTAPYAVTADGETVEEPWNVCIDGKAAAMTASKEDGEKLIENIKNYYIKDETGVEEVTIEEELTVEPAELERGEEPPVIKDLEESLKDILSGEKKKETYEVKKNDTAKSIASVKNVSTKALKSWNEDVNLSGIDTGEVLTIYKVEPLVHVSYIKNVTYTKDIAHKTTYIKSDKLSTGETKTKRAGKDGVKKITVKVKKENGKIVSKKIVSSKVVRKPVKAIVYKGTKAKGNSVVEYASRFIGNPYVYGGASLTGGTDCSGFTMSVYAHFGYSLPHNSYAQLNCGRAVSYSNAQPGDLIIYHDHVALYAGGGQIIHASSPSTGIKTGSATYRSIIGVRRIIQ